MKKIFLLFHFYMCISIWGICQDSWQLNWLDGVSLYENKKYFEAINKYDLAISEIGMCKEKKDILFFSSKIVIITKKCSSENLNTITMGKVKTSEEYCRNWCDKSTAAASAWCGKLRNPWCVGFCLAFVETLRQGCHECCSDGNFYENCIKPFEDILSKLPAPCNDLLDD